MLPSLQIPGKTLYQQKDYDSLYCDTIFIVVIWNKTHSISEVCLHMVWGRGLTSFLCTWLSSCWKTIGIPIELTALAPLLKAPDSYWILLLGHGAVIGKITLSFFFFSTQPMFGLTIFTAGFRFSTCYLPFYLSQQYWVISLSDVQQSFLVHVLVSHSIPWGRAIPVIFSRGNWVT